MGRALKIRLTDGSGSIDLKFLVKDIDRHGNARIYFRRIGRPKVRLHASPGTRDFLAEYDRAFQGETQPVKRSEAALSAVGTMRWLCEQYYGSAAFKSLGETTRKVRRGILEGICERAGSFQHAKMESHNVAKLRDEKADFPEAANARVKALRQLFAWASSPAYRYAERNPAREVEYLKSKNPAGFYEWTEQEVAMFEKRHPVGTYARLALDLFLYTGARRSDVVRLGPAMEKDGKIHFTETKGSAHVVKHHEIPILGPLRESIDATPSSALAYLITSYGRPHSVKAFGNWFKKQCVAAGLPHCSAHGLRKVSARRCAEAGATEHQLMALFGWTTSKQAARYTRNANRVNLEANAAALLVPAQNSQSVPLLPGDLPGGTIGAKTP